MKIAGPLHSTEAHGTIRSLIIFSRRTGQNIARGFYKPLKPASAAQVDQRAIFLGIIIEWRTLSDAEKAVWVLLLGTLPYISSYHFFLQAPETWRKLRMFGNAKFNQFIFGSLKTKV